MKRKATEHDSTKHIVIDIFMSANKPNVHAQLANASGCYSCLKTKRALKFDYFMYIMVLAISKHNSGMTSYCSSRASFHTDRLTVHRSIT